MTDVDKYSSLSQILYDGFKVAENECLNLYVYLMTRYQSLKHLQRKQFHLVVAILAVILTAIILRLGLSWCVRRQERQQKDLYGISVYDLAKRAYIKGNMAKVILLQEKMGLDVNRPLPSNGMTLFLCACVSGERSLVLHLIERGADIRATSLSGDSALYLATHGVLTSPQPDLRLISDLIIMGLDVNQQNQNGYTPLHRAASRGQEDVVQVLLKHGADPHIPTKKGIYPIDFAINNGHDRVIPMLVVDVDRDHVWEVVEPHTPIHVALGLLTPSRKHLVESTQHETSFNSRINVTEVTSSPTPPRRQRQRIDESPTAYPRRRRMKDVSPTHRRWSTSKNDVSPTHRRWSTSKNDVSPTHRRWSTSKNDVSTE